MQSAQWALYLGTLGPGGADRIPMVHPALAQVLCTGQESVLLWPGNKEESPGSIARPR